MNTPLLYVAGPYAANDQNTEQDHIEHAEYVSISLIKSGFHVITPHKNTSGYEKYEDENITFETWMKMDLNILKRCDGIYLFGKWYNSKGALIEVEYVLDNDMLRFTDLYYPVESFTLEMFYDVKIRYQKL